jgi:hypothetical protein
MLRICNVLLLMCVFHTNLIGQVTPEQITTRFFSLYEDSGSTKALAYIFATNKNIDPNAEEFVKLVNQLQHVSQEFGRFHGADLISRNQAGANLVMYIFLGKHEIAPLTFKLLFYKPRDRWQLQNFRFDNNIDEELDKKQFNAP